MTFAPLLVLLVVMGAPSLGLAQDAEGQRPGVIQRDGQQADDEQDQDTGEQEEQQAQQAQNQQNQQNQDQPDGQVITPENVDPNEQYNLPPNFDPDYRPRRTPRSTRVTLDFRQANLEEVVKFFAAAMNRNFIISDSLQANKTITIISPEEVTLAEAYRAFVAALEMNGLTIVPFGKFLKIVQAQEAISSGIETYTGDDRLPNVPRMVTAIIPVENTPVEEMEQLIGNFASQNANIIIYGSSLIITENASNLERLRDMIRQLDQDEGAQQVYVYDVQYAEATEIQQQLMEIFQGEGAQTPQQPQRRRRRSSNQQQQTAADEDSSLNVQISQVLADERTNKLIIVANPRDFEKIRSMIEILDVPTAVGGQVHVKFLEYADSEEIASTLSNLTSGAGSQQQNQGAARGRARQQAQQAVGGEVAALLQGEVQITAYRPNNALVVTAAPKDFVALESVIELLDRPRKQVYVEAVILEIDVDTDRQLGIGASAVTGQDYGGIIPDSAIENGLIDDTQGGVIGQSNFGGLGSLFGGGVAGSIGLIGPIATIPGTEISLPAFALTLQATQTDSSVNLLSAPSVMTMDNEEAEIVVADRVPIVSGLASGLGGLGGLAGLGGLGGQTGQTGTQGLGGLGALGGLGGLVSPIEYEDVGITLRILPQINESSFVRLEIDQEVTDLAGASTLGDEIPARTKRTAKTVVLVEDQSTIVIGGLMKEQENETISKIPFLGDIPVLGVLFRSTGTRTTKQNLVLMLTPYIIESESDVRKIYERKMEERKELAKLFNMREKEYVKNVNFQKTSGIVEKMRNQLSTVERRAQARREALEEFQNQGSRYQILGQEPAQDGQDQDDQQNQGQPNQRQQEPVQRRRREAPPGVNQPEQTQQPQPQQ